MGETRGTAGRCYLLLGRRMNALAISLMVGAMLPAPAGGSGAFRAAAIVSAPHCPAIRVEVSGLGCFPDGTRLTLPPEQAVALIVQGFAVLA